MCGLAGIISNTKTVFNINHFNILGILNDERGEDSCGTFIDGQTSYGIKDTKLFRNFTLSMKYPEGASIALLHCRKASMGYPVSIEQAQPVVIKEDGKIKFVLMHNGTISNIRELSQKYLKKPSNYSESDSQILAKIIYNFGYKVLEEYQGTAALVMVDYRTPIPEVLLFKGSSCYNEINSTSERPLYYMIYDNKFYFSSIHASLYSINYKSTIYNFPTNKVYKIENNELKEVLAIDRSTLKKPLTTLNIGLFKNNRFDYCQRIEYDSTSNRYMTDGEWAHGIYHLTPIGNIIIHDNYKCANNQFCFFQGRLLYNKDCYDFLESISALYTENVLPDLCPEIIDYFSYHPCVINKQLCEVDENFNYVPYTEGTYVTLFSDPSNILIKDQVLTKKIIFPTHAINIFHKTVKGMYFNFDTLEPLIFSIITSKLTNYENL